MDPINVVKGLFLHFKVHLYQKIFQNVNVETVCANYWLFFFNILEPKETQRIRNIRAMFKGVEWGAKYLDTYAIIVIGYPIE